MGANLWATNTCLQYNNMSRVEQELSAMPDDDDDDNDDHKEDITSSKFFYDGLDWLADHVRAPNNDNNENSDGNGDGDGRDGDGELTPVSGSGLYPLLILANHDCDPNASIEFLQESDRGSMVALRDIIAGEEICISYVPPIPDDDDDDDNDDEDKNKNDLSDDNNADNPETVLTKHFLPTRTAIWLTQQMGKPPPSSEVDEFKEQEQDNENSSDIDGHSGESCDDDDDDDDDGRPLEEIYDDDTDKEDHQYSGRNKSGDSDSGVASKKQHESNDTSAMDDDEGFSLAELEVGLESSHVLKERSKPIQEYGFECHCNRCRHVLAKPDTPYIRKRAI